MRGPVELRSKNEHGHSERLEESRFFYPLRAIQNDTLNITSLTTTRCQA